MGPEVHHLCPVSATSVEGATGDTQFLAPVHLLRVCADGLDSQILSKCVSLVLLMGTHGL